MLFDHRTLAILLSMVCHVALLLLMAVMIVGVDSAKQALVVVASLSGSEANKNDAESVFELTSSPESPATPDVEPAQSQSSQATIEPFDLGIDIGDLEASTLAKSQSATLSSWNASGAISGGAMSVKTSETGSGSDGATFFGSYASGNRFVFVVDSSASMLGDRWDLARARLLSCLRELGPNAQFFVFCFDIQTSLLFNCAPNQIAFQSANSATVDRVERWLRSRKLGMATMPAEALGMALQLQPDAIFLLSDGELHDESRSLLQAWNKEKTNFRRIPIHTIHLISEDGEETLKLIAKENDGTFIHVTEQMALPHNLRAN